MTTTQTATAFVAKPLLPEIDTREVFLDWTKEQKDFLVKNQDNMSPEELSDVLGLSVHNVYMAIHCDDPLTIPKGRSARQEKIVELVRLCPIHMSQRDIAKALGMSDSGLKHILYRHGTSITKIMQDKKKAIVEYAEKNQHRMTNKEIAAHFGVSKTFLCRIYQEFDFKKAIPVSLERKLAQNNTKAEIMRYLADHPKRQYGEMASLSRKYGVPITTLKNWAAEIRGWQIYQQSPALQKGIIMDQKTIYEQTIGISQHTADVLAEYLSNKQHQPEDDTYSVTATFPDGKQMDIKCCGVQDEDEGSWTEAVLFDKNGTELCYTEVEEEFLGTWELERDGILYRAIVTVA